MRGSKRAQMDWNKLNPKAICTNKKKKKASRLMTMEDLCHNKPRNGSGVKIRNARQYPRCQQVVTRAIWRVDNTVATGPKRSG